MMEKVKDEKLADKTSFEDALDLTGFGRYNIIRLASCCVVILTMMIDVFGFSVALPAAACDLSLTPAQQGLLSLSPLFGVMISSYAWGLSADTLGRRKTLLIAMPFGVFFTIATSFAPTFNALVLLKFLSSCFTSSANAAAFVLLGESVSRSHRSRCMWIMASVSMGSQMVTSALALPIYNLTFRIPIPWLGMDYRPWRLLILLVSFPGIFGILSIWALHESPKFLLSKGKADQALEVLQCIFKCNKGLDKRTFPVESIYLDDISIKTDLDPNKSWVRKIWDQTAPLFKPPLVRNSVIVYYTLLCAYMTSTGYTIWVPTMVNAYFNGDDTAGKTFCEVASTAVQTRNNTNFSTDCDHVVPTLTLYAVIVYSAVATVSSLLLTLIIKPVGKKRTTLAIFIVSIVAGILLYFVTIPALSIALFYMFLYVALILGNVNTYLVELNPTYLRGMATCLSMVVARGFGVVSVQLIAVLLADYCEPMLLGYILLVCSGFVVAWLLPSDKQKTDTN